MKIISKIFCIAIPLFAVIALFLRLNGIEHLEFNNDYYRFMSNVLQNSEIFQMEIPEIPDIPLIGNGFLDAIIGFINGLTSVINILIVMLNVVIKMLSFILGLVKTIIESIKDIFINGNITVNAFRL